MLLSMLVFSGVFRITGILLYVSKMIPYKHDNLNNNIKNPIRLLVKQIST